jgi:hypothetical protein
MSLISKEQKAPIYTSYLALAPHRVLQVENPAVVIGAHGNYKLHLVSIVTSEQEGCAFECGCIEFAWLAVPASILLIRLEP